MLDPSQLIVKQARDKVDKLVSDMEENQRIEMKSFQENLENNSREFNEKQKEELENFAVKIEKESHFYSLYVHRACIAKSFYNQA